MVYGFQSTKFILHDSSTEEDAMLVECGGAHRSWAFQSHPSGFGGTLVWTRAATMQIYSQDTPSYRTIRSGGHGREIKAVAASVDSPSSKMARLIATGAEDTSIKIFKYEHGDVMDPMSAELTCIRTLRKHSTGIQHLQWSEDCKYLFSSGGCEEFYVWRVTILPIIGLGVVCESVCAPISEQSDLRITSFNIRCSGAGFVICMVYSDSTLRVSHLLKFDKIRTLTRTDLYIPSSRRNKVDAHFQRNIWHILPNTMHKFLRCNRHIRNRRIRHILAAPLSRFPGGTRHGRSFH